MTLIETNRTAAAAQTIATEILGQQVGVTEAGRLGVEIALGAGWDTQTIWRLREALAGGGRAAVLTEPA